MIDWPKTTQELNLTQDNVVNSKKVYVICEKCGYNRLQFYNVAGRKSEHICMSCCKVGKTDYPEINLEKTKALGTIKISTGKIVVAKCCNCGDEVSINFTHNRFPNFKCGSCKISEKWKKGEYKPNIGKFTLETRAKIGEQAKKKWQDTNYRTKWCVTHASTKDKRSRFSKQLWSDPERLKRLSETLKKYYTSNPDNIKYRQFPEYRKRMSESIIKLWQKQEHIEFMRNIYSDPILRLKLSENAKKLWENSEYYNFHKTPEWAAKTTKENHRRWNNEIFKAKLMQTFNSNEFRIKMAKICLSQPKTSSQQKILYSLLDDLKIKYYDDQAIECMIGYYCFDCRIDPQLGINLKKPLLIEVQGDYWHNLPKAISRDKSKATYLKTYFPEYDLKYLWEHEFNNKDRIINLLKYWLGMCELSINKVEFDNINSKIIDSKTAELFIGKYHYAGRIGRSGVNLGYYLGDELIAVIIYVNPTRQETALKQNIPYKEVLELSRLTIHPKYQVKNLASYLISKSINYIKQTKPEIKLLVSFADSTYNHLGTIYKASNWGLDGEVAPDYWYADNNGYICHKKTLWNKAKKHSMLESEYCSKFGYNKVWGDKKFRYIYRL